MKKLAVAREDVYHAVGPRRRQQSALRVPRKDHRAFSMIPGIHHKQRVHVSSLKASSSRQKHTAGNRLWLVDFLSREYGDSEKALQIYGKP